MLAFVCCSVALLFGLSQADEDVAVPLNSLLTMFDKPQYGTHTCQEALGTSVLQTGYHRERAERPHGQMGVRMEIEEIDSSIGQVIRASGQSMGHLSNSSNINSSTVYFSTKHSYAWAQRPPVTAVAAALNLTWVDGEIELRTAGRKVIGAFQDLNVSDCDPTSFEWVPGAAYSKWVNMGGSLEVPYFGTSRQRLQSISDELLSVHPDITLANLSSSALGSVRYLWRQLSSKPAGQNARYSYSKPFGIEELPLHLRTPDTSAPSGGWPVILHIPGGHWGYQQILAPEVPAALEELFNMSQSFAIATISLRQINEHKIYPFPRAVLHPAELEDAITAVQFLVANAAVLQINPDRMVVHGVSSGANVAATLPVALAREPQLVNGTKLLGAMVIEGPSDLLSLQHDHLQKEGLFEVSCDTASSKLIGCGSTHGVSIQNLTDMLRSVDLLLTTANVPHSLGSNCSADPTNLAGIREDEVYQELLTSIAMAQNPTAQVFAEQHAMLSVMSAAEVLAHLGTEHGALNLTVALLTALSASPAVQVAGAHAEGHHLPPYLLYHSKADSDIPCKQSWRLVAALQESNTDFTMFMAQFGNHSTYPSHPLWDEFALTNRTTSIEALQSVLVHHDVVKLLLPTWLTDISFFDIMQG